MAISVSIFELHLPEARSLKQKRKVIKSLIERIHRRFRVSIAETDHHDLHQRSEISLAAVARSDGAIQRLTAPVRVLSDIDHAAFLPGCFPHLL